MRPSLSQRPCARAVAGPGRGPQPLHTLTIFAHQLSSLIHCVATSLSDGRPGRPVAARSQRGGESSRRRAGPGRPAGRAGAGPGRRGPTDTTAARGRALAAARSRCNRAAPSIASRTSTEVTALIRRQLCSRETDAAAQARKALSLSELESGASKLADSDTVTSDFGRRVALPPNCRMRS